MKNFFNSLFWKISAVFLLVLILISFVYMLISINTAELYFQETRQKLDINIASHIADYNNFFSGDSINQAVLKEVFHNVMVINPSIEVYLLDTAGKILSYYAPNQSVLLKKVPLNSIRQFIASKKETFLLGVDPKNPGAQKAFSAAKVFEGGKFMGYIYVILGGQEYENASQLFYGSYILRLGVRSMIIALVAALVIGFLAIGFIIRNIRKIVSVIREFQDGNLHARIKFKSKGELREFADSFNGMADTIVKNMEKIRKMDDQRRELVANVSHDLRTPISIIRGYVETVLIKEDTLSQIERKQYLETILKSTDRLLNLVEELFELSKLEAKEKIPSLEIFSLTELIQDIHQKNLINARSRNITFNLDISGASPFINADIGMIEKVFQNLIDNALKFTPPDGQVTLTVSTKDPDSLTASVSDSGPGLTEEEIAHIFDRFYQVKRVSSPKSSGTGLGLAIVKKIMDLHGFEITVESMPTVGTSFILTFPAIKRNVVPV